jgi:hypothetical protein
LTAVSGLCRAVDRPQGPPGCNARVSVLKHKLAATGGTAQVLIHFADEVRW